MKKQIFRKSLLSIVAIATLVISHTTSYGQWIPAGPNTYIDPGNVGIGVDPATDARLKIINNCTNSPGGNPNYKIPAIYVQRNLFWPLVNGFPVANVMEVWKQDITLVPPITGPNELKFVIDGDGQVGINKQPAAALDVADNGNIDGTLTVGSVAGTSSAVDALTVEGNIAFIRPLDGQYRNLRAHTSDGALAFLANTGGEDGPAIVLNGKTNTTGGAGMIALSCYGTSGNAGFMFNNYDPTGAGTWSTRMSINTDGKVIIGNPAMSTPTGYRLNVEDGIFTDGKVVIGPSTLPTPSGYNLYVDNGILTKRIKVALPSDLTNWSDFVFAHDYKLRSLSELENYIAANKHLPEIPSTEEVHKEGLDLAQMDAKLLQKIEELTLYVIKQQKEIEALKKRNK